MSPIAKGGASWFRQLARAMKTTRLYRAENPLVLQVRNQVVQALQTQVRTHGAWMLRFTPSEIHLGDEVIVAPKVESAMTAETFQSAEEKLPFMFYRDGVRSIRVLPSVPTEDAENFFDALALGCTESPTYEDLVTLLWQANLKHIQVDSVPLEQTFYLSAHGSARRESTGNSAPILGNAVAGTEVRANIGQATGVQGLHMDTFDDWGVPAGEIDVIEAYEQLDANAEALRGDILTYWRNEKDGDWDRAVPELFRRILLIDDSDDTRNALAHASATWLLNMLERHQIARACKALELVGDVDPHHKRANEVLNRSLGTVDAASLAEFLDEADAVEQGRCAGLLVRMGGVATPLTFQVMARAARSRTRAAAATALCYQCADQPELLKPYIDDPRLDVMLNLVFVLGQIGGKGVVDMLRLAAQHSDPRVRRQAVLSLGGVPEAERVPVLLDELARLDPHILGTTLGLLARQRDEQISRFIIGLISDPEFENRSEDVQRALFNALAEVAEDSAIPALEKLLNHNPGWLAKRSYTQFAAALTLFRLGTPKARGVLQQGLKSRHGTVRSACADAMGGKAAA